MKKSDLKNFMSVKMRNGEMLKVIDGLLLSIGNNTWDELENYDDNLNQKDSFDDLDIVEIFSIPVLKGDYLNSYGVSIWKRYDKLELTIDEIADKFGVSPESIKIKK